MVQRVSVVPVVPMVPVVSVVFSKQSKTSSIASWGLGVGVEFLGFRVQLVFKVYGFTVQSFRVQGFGF